MSNTNTGGPAFPSTHPHGQVEGMTLRDYFAANAPDVPDDFGWIAKEADCCERLVRWRFYYADAMLKAREA